MQIKYYRKVAVTYPWLFMETQVFLSDGRTVYAVLSVNNKEKEVELEEDNHWIYSVPSDEIDFYHQDDYFADIPADVEENIFATMLTMWNKNPVFFNDFTWRDIQREEKLFRLLEENKDEDEMTPEEKDLYDEFIANLYGPPFDEEETEEYRPSATAGDYSPNTPWNAPGMSVRDFI